MVRKRLGIRLKTPEELLQEDLEADFGSGEPDDTSDADGANDGPVKYETAD
jgi:hypothetical protein